MTNQPRCIDLFKQDMDTIAIAEHLGGMANGWTEARVYNTLAKERAKEELDKLQRPLIRYAGHDRHTKAWGGR